MKMKMNLFGDHASAQYPFGNTEETRSSLFHFPHPTSRLMALFKMMLRFIKPGNKNNDETASFPQLKKIYFSSLFQVIQIAPLQLHSAT